MKRKYEAVKNYPGIYRVLVSLNGISWTEPKRGCKYAASRYEENNNPIQRSKQHFRTFEEAKEFRARISQPKKSNMIIEGKHVTPQDSKSKFTFEELIKLYERTTLPNRSPSTQVRYRHYLKHFDFFKGMDVEAIDTITIDNWIIWLKRPEYLATQHSTRCNFKHEFSLLRSMLGVYTSRINRNFRMPFIKEHRSSLKVKEAPLAKKDLSPTELVQFLTKLKELCEGTTEEYVYHLAIIQYFTFSRIQEASALHFEDFDLQRKEVHLNKKLIFGRSRKEQTFLVTGAKANSGKILPISDMLTQAFREWTMKSSIRQGPLFAQNGVWPRYRLISHRYTKALKLAGLPYTATHILRHASLTEAQESSGDLNQTKLLAGHTSIKTTERYAKVRSNQLRETQSKLDSKFSTLLDGSQRFAFEKL